MVVFIRVLRFTLYFKGVFIQEEDFSLRSFVVIVLYFLGTKIGSFEGLHAYVQNIGRSLSLRNAVETIVHPVL